MGRRLLFLWLLVLFGWPPTGLLAAEGIPAVVEHIKPAVVTITTYDEAGEALRQGSGFFIRANHVISARHLFEGAASARVRLHDGRTSAVAGVLDEDERQDLILLQLPMDAVSRPLKVVGDLPSVGERVVVAGSPLGLEFSLSDGIVSAIRDLPRYGRVIQITAPLSVGSSGSPVVNLRGQVVGVATLQMNGGQNINFAVPGRRLAALRPGERRPLTARFGRLAPADPRTWMLVRLDASRSDDSRSSSHQEIPSLRQHELTVLRGRPSTLGLRLRKLLSGTADDRPVAVVILPPKTSLGSHLPDDRQSTQRLADFLEALADRLRDAR